MKYAGRTWGSSSSLRIGMIVRWKSFQTVGRSKYGFIPGNGDGIARPSDSQPAAAVKRPVPMPLLGPRVAPHMIPQPLPETRVIPVHELHAPHPFRAFPGVE